MNYEERPPMILALPGQYEPVPPPPQSGPSFRASTAGGRRAAAVQGNRNDGAHGGRAKAFGRAVGPSNVSAAITRGVVLWPFVAVPLFLVLLIGIDAAMA